MIFSDSPSQKALERMMTQVKGFPPRGSGVMVLRRFEYTAEMCDCRLCLYYNRKKKCTVSQCPCIEERIVAGAADRSEVMAETMKNIHNAAFHMVQLHRCRVRRRFQRGCQENHSKRLLHQWGRPRIRRPPADAVYLLRQHKEQPSHHHCKGGKSKCLENRKC